MHNKKILNKDNNKNNNNCNCINKLECPLKQQCLQTEVVYKATIAAIENPSDKRILHWSGRYLLLKIDLECINAHLLTLTTLTKPH